MGHPGEYETWAHPSKPRIGDLSRVTTVNTVSNIGRDSGIFADPPMSSPGQLEDRIRVLCTLALSAKNDAALNVVLPQLQAAIAEHTKQMREMAAKEIPRVFRPESNAAD
jgi:hypothetical protein